MKINIHSIDFTFSQKLNELLHKKLQKFGRLCGDAISIEVMLRLDKSDIKANKVCGIRLVIPGNDMLSRAQCRTFEETIAQAVDALKRQIEKRKTRIIARRIKNTNNNVGKE